MNDLSTRLALLAPETLRSLRRGIEKESLRVRPDGVLADTQHPPGLGSALTHPHVTTDYSEAQLELITAAHPSARACLAQLTEIHHAVYGAIGDELLWCASMPCGLPSDGAIPIARYGRSNAGRAKTVYRIGLGHRYGRRMQMISGVHYNFSLPESAWPALMPALGRTDDAYFALIRNFRRCSWLLLYLFGASPAVCSTFVEGREHHLQTLRPGTFYLPGGTSLRMGRLGYQSDAQAALAVSFNGLERYTESLHEAMTKPYPAYEAIGLRQGDDYCQLATSLLQIENEFYGTIRPKRRIKPGERPLHALHQRGVEYVEVRCMDLDPFHAVGITADTMHFLDIFLLHCLLSPSPPDTPAEIETLARNQHLVAERGREPGLRLTRFGEEVALADWAAEILRECAPIAEAMDAAGGGRAHRAALDTARRALADPARLPSARMLREMLDDCEGSYTQYVLERSREHAETLRALPFAADVDARYARMAAESVAAQRAIEAADKVPFETYRQQYLGQSLLAGRG